MSDRDDVPYAAFELPGPGVARRGEELAGHFAGLVDALAAMHRQQDWMRFVDGRGLPYRGLHQAVREIWCGPAGARTGYQLRTGRRLPRLSVASFGSHLAIASLIPVQGLTHRARGEQK